MKNQRNRTRHLLGLALALIGSLIGLSGWIALAHHTSSRPAPSGSDGLAKTSNSGKSEAPAVHALFDLVGSSGGPFPSNRFTVADESQNTGLRINLPLPDCAERTSDCADLEVLNTLDGFNLQPRLSIPFDGPIDVATATSESVFLISLGDTLADEDRDDDEDRRGGDRDLHDRGRSGIDSERDSEDEDHGGSNGHRGGRIIGINQVVWDPLTNTLHVESDELLDQHTRYALIVTNGLRDLEGRPVEASAAFQRFRRFRRFRQEVRGNYKRALLEAIRAARQVGIRKDDIAVASVFTTQSVSAMLEKIRDDIKRQIPRPADFNLGLDGSRTVFSLGSLAGITWNQQTGVNPPRIAPSKLRLERLQIIPGAVGELGFGKYWSPDYLVHPGEFIPPIGTKSGQPEIQRMNEIYFTLSIPAGPKPAEGWPVAIFSHAGAAPENAKDTGLLAVAASMAAQGVATITINTVGFGFGPLSTLTVTTTAGSTLTFPTGGRGIDQNGDGVIDANEGFVSPSIVTDRDTSRQTVADLMQLVRVIETGGIDVDGDGFPDLDPARIYCFGSSQGGSVTSVFLSVESGVRAGVIAFGGGARVDRRLAPTLRPGVGGQLASRIPSLLNPPGLSTIGGFPVNAPHFDENLPLRNQPPVINTVRGALEIQEWIEHSEWVTQAANPVAYAPYIRRQPLPGQEPKAVIVQFGKGDQAVAGPTTTAFLRAGELADRATYVRHDLAVAEDPTLPRSPHAFLFRIDHPNALARAMALGGQEQIGQFFSTDGVLTIHPKPQRFFEVPVVLPLPEDLFFIR